MSHSTITEPGELQEGDSPPIRIDAINLEEKLARFTGYFAPRTVAQFDGHDVMVVKLMGPFLWHKHDDADDFFLVIHGTLDIDYGTRRSRYGQASCWLCREALSIVP